MRRLLFALPALVALFAVESLYGPAPVHSEDSIVAVAPDAAPVAADVAIAPSVDFDRLAVLTVEASVGESCQGLDGVFSQIAAIAGKRCEAHGLRYGATYAIGEASSRARIGRSSATSSNLADSAFYLIGSGASRIDPVPRG